MTSLSTFHVRCDFDLQSRKYGVKSLREFNRPKQHWYFIHLIVDLMLNQIGRGNFLVPMYPAAMYIERKLSNDFYLLLDSALLYFNLYDVADLMFKIEKVIFRDLCCEYFRNAQCFTYHLCHRLHSATLVQKLLLPKYWKTLIDALGNPIDLIFLVNLNYLLIAAMLPEMIYKNVG